MSDILIRKTGRAGHITLTREAALNALSYDMCLAVDRALQDWRDDPSVDLIILDAAGERAFCAGGDIAEMYRTGMAGDYSYGRRFWHDEYRMNARIAEYPKPIASFLQGFVMGGGVGLGGHASHRICCETTRIAMPEVGIGLVPDVGGSALLARAPGRLGAYLGLTAARMGPADAIYAGFADHYVPQEKWPALKQIMVESGKIHALHDAATALPPGPLAQAQKQIDRLFAPGPLGEIAQRLQEDQSPLALEAHKALMRGAPLSLACALDLLGRLQAMEGFTIRDALRLEYRVTYRIMEHGDFLEGIRAAIIDKDKSPRWRHALDAVPSYEVERMLAPLGDQELRF